jgi:hypothetical protein
MTPDKELMDFLEEERRKYALMFSVRYPRHLYRKLPKSLLLAVPIIFVCFLLILLFQYHQIRVLEEQNIMLTTSVERLEARSEWYKAAYEAAVISSNATNPLVRRPPADPFNPEFWGTGG